MAMNISTVTGVASAFEGARLAGQQQAASTASAAQTKRDDDRNAQDTDVKKTDTVTQDQETGQSSNDPNGHRLNVVV
jgi:hypothetical protein